MHLLELNQIPLCTPQFQPWIEHLESRVGSADNISLSREEGQELI